VVTRRSWSGSPYEERFGFCRAMRIGDRVVVAGTAPIWPDGRVELDAKSQTRGCFEIIEAALAELGASLADVIRTRIFLVDVADADEVGAVHGEIFRRDAPVATMVQVAKLLDPSWRVEIEAEAMLV